MKKKVLTILGFCVLLMWMGLMVSSCSPKTGCPINEKASVQVNRKGKLPSRGGSSSLFPKSMRKKGKKKKKKS